MLGLGSYTFRWSAGHKGVAPEVPMTAFDVLEVAISHKIRLIQFADNMPLSSLTDTDLKLLSARANAKGIKLEVGVQGFDVDEIERYLAICEIAKSSILRIALDAAEAKQGVSELAEEFSKFLPKARQLGVRIAIENHFNYPSRQLAELVTTINDPSVGVCLDVANSICAGEWPEETISVLAPHTINLHLKDYVIKPDPFGVGFRIVGMPLGTGKTDCKAVLRALQRDPNISVILEHWLPMEDSLQTACALEHEWLAQSLDYARNDLGFN